MSNTSRRFFLGLVLAACALPLAVDAQSVDLVGSWHLVEWVLGDGTPRCSEKEGGVSGLLVYTSDEHMSAQLGCSGLDVSDLSGLSPQAAAGRLSRRHFTYYGTYTLDMSAQTVTHHVQGGSSVRMVGTDQVRSFVLEGQDQITLSPGGGQMLVWLRNR